MIKRIINSNLSIIDYMMYYLQVLITIKFINMEELYEKNMCNR